MFYRRADRVRLWWSVPGSTAFRRMALSEAIPITPAAWVSQAQPILRKAPRRKTVAPTPPANTTPRRMALSEAIPITTAAWVSQAQPILRKAPRRKTVAPTPPANTTPRRMALSEAIPITTAAWVSQAQPILRRAHRRKTVAPTTVLHGTVGADSVRDSADKGSRASSLLQGWRDQTSSSGSTMSHSKLIRPPFSSALPPVIGP